MDFKSRAKKKTLKEWLSEPATIKDRRFSAFLGAWAGLWYGAIAGFIYSSPISIFLLGKFIFGGSIICCSIGALVPKYSRFIFYPFAFIGIGSN